MGTNKGARKGAEVTSSSVGQAVIDAIDFVRQSGREVRGVAPVASLQRLAAGLPRQTGDVQWRATSARGALGEALIRLEVDAPLVLECQRCLSNFELPIVSEAVLHIVESESELDVDAGQDDDFDDDGEEDADVVDTPERVLGSQRFNLLEQVEDELILCVPYVPRHDVCPVALEPKEEAPVETRPSPFAVLAGLKTPKH